MITYEQATATHLDSGFYIHDAFEHVSATNSDGTPQRFRRNGRTKTWKTRPGEFRIPVKRGLYETGYITHENASEFRVT